MELGQAGALNYRMTFPGQQQMAARGIAPQQTGVERDYLDSMSDDPLAVRRQLTADYFNSYALLQKIAKDASAKGIDVFKPDYSQDGGGLAFQAFQEAEAGLLYAANALKNEREKEKELAPYLAKNQIVINPGVDRNSQLWATQGDYTSTEPLPFIQESNKFSQDNTYTSRDEQRYNQAYAQRALQQIDQMEGSGQLDPYQAQIQRANIQRNVSQVYAPAYFDKGDGSSKKESKSMLNLFERLANHTRGVFPEGTYKTKIYGGEQYSVSNDFRGDNFGKKTVYKQDKMGNVMEVEADRKITETLKDQQGNVYFLLDDGEKVNVSGMSPDEVARTIFESNSSKYGGAGSLPMLYNELNKAGYLSNTGTVPTTAVFGQGAVEQVEKARPNIPGFDRIQQHYKKQFNDLANPDGGMGTLKVPSKDGRQYIFAFDEDDGVYLQNWKELGYADSEQTATINKPPRPINMNLEQYTNMLDQVGAFDVYLSNRNKNTTKKLTVPDNLTADQQKAIVQFRIREGRDPANEQELKQVIGTKKKVVEIDPDI